MLPTPSKKLKSVHSAWRDFETHMPVKLRTIQNERSYQNMIDFMDELLDEIGERESHPLIGLLDVVSLLIHDYEEREIEYPDSGRSKKSVRARASARFETAVVYRGVKIPTIRGKRSPTALALRHALLSKYSK